MSREGASGVWAEKEETPLQAGDDRRGRAGGVKVAADLCDCELNVKKSLRAATVTQ